MSRESAILMPGTRRALGQLLVAVAAIEFAAVLWVLVVAPFELHFGPIPIMARSASKPFLIGVLLGSVAVWLLEPFQPAGIRSRLATVTGVVACVAAVVSIVPLARPIFLPHFLIGHDGGVHQTYSFLLNRALGQGQLPVRWVEGLADGLGQPLFSFYQGGFYYLVAVIHRCGPALSLSIKLAIAILWAAGPAFMFMLCRSLGVMPAVLGAVVLAWAPYMLLNVYVRTAYPEFMAIALAPGVLWSIDRVLTTGRPVFVCALALATALLLISHLPAALILAPVVAAYVLGSFMVHRRQLSLLGLVARGAVMGAGLAAFYVVPAILELDQVHMSRLTAADFDYRRHFVQPEWWIDWSWAYGPSGVGAADRLSLQIGIVQWMVIATSVTALAVPAVRRRSASQRLSIVGWLTVVGGAMLMMTEASAGVWARIAPLAYIQFPWRWLMVPALACGVLAATLLSIVKHRTSQALVVVCIVAVQWYVTSEYRGMASSQERGDIAIDDPAWPSTPSARRWSFRESGYDPISVAPQNSRRLPSGRWTVVAGRANVSAVAEEDARLRLHVHAEESSTLVINSPYFNGWRVSINGQRTAPAIQPLSGYMEVSVPPGTHEVEAVLGRSRVRAVAEALTLISLLAWLLMLSRAAFAMRPSCLTWPKSRAGSRDGSCFTAD